MTTKLYPLRFHAITQDKIWGGYKLADKFGKAPAGTRVGESWEISTVEGNVSVVENGELAGRDLQSLIIEFGADLLGQKVFTKYSQDFPLLVKIIDAGDKLSIQVHPDDAMAQAKHGDPFGKNEMWYIMDCDPEAELVIGFNQELDRTQYHELVAAGKIKEIINHLPVSKGDVIDIPAGRLHAIGAGNLIVEIQQNSDTTYRVYDWDRLDDAGNPRELHVDLAEEALDFTPIKDYKVQLASENPTSQNVVSNPYFQVNLVELSPTENLTRSPQKLDSFLTYTCTQGQVEISTNETNDGQKLTLNPGESCLIPANLIAITLRSTGTEKAILLEAHL